MPNATRTLPQAVIDAWKNGRKVEAIGLLRELTGLGLAEAKAVLDALDTARKDARPGAGAASASPPRTANLRFKRDRNFSIAKRPPSPFARDPKLSPGEVPRASGTTGALLVALILGAVLVYLVLK